MEIQEGIISLNESLLGQRSTYTRGIQCFPIFSLNHFYIICMRGATLNVRSENNDLLGIKKKEEEKKKEEKVSKIEFKKNSR